MMWWLSSRSICRQCSLLLSTFKVANAPLNTSWGTSVPFSEASQAAETFNLAPSPDKKPYELIGDKWRGWIEQSDKGRLLSGQSCLIASNSVYEAAIFWIGRSSP